MRRWSTRGIKIALRIRSVYQHQQFQAGTVNADVNSLLHATNNNNTDANTKTQTAREREREEERKMKSAEDSGLLP